MRRIISLVLSLAILLSLAMVGGVTAFATNEFKMSQEAIDMIKNFEGFRDKPYWDVAQYTIGYGTKCPDDKVEYYKTNGMTEEEAEELLKEYVASFERSVNNFANTNGLTLTQNQFDALCSFSYNLGTAWMTQNNSTFRKVILDPERTPEDVLYWFGVYSNAGSVSVALIYRRLVEANMFLNGVYSNVRPANYCYVLVYGNGGTVNNTVCAYDVNSAERVDPVVTRSGYNFAGWYTADGRKITTLDASTHSLSLYASWTDGDGYDAGFLPGDPLPDPVKVTVTNNAVNLRKGPGTNYTTIGRADKGDQLTITQIAEGGSYTWGCYGDGWIALKYTNYDSVIAGDGETETPDETPDTPETPEDTEGSDEIVAALIGVVKVNSSLSIRSGAGTGYSRVGYLNNGDEVEILEVKEVGASAWGKIDRGWISLDYVELYIIAETPEGTTPEDTTPEAPETTEPQEPEDTTPEEPQQTSVKVTVTNNYVNLRKGPGTNYTTIGTANKGDQLTITQTQQGGNYLWGCYGDGWIALNYTNYESAIKGETETPEETPSQTPAKVMGTVKVSSTLTIRKDAGTGYERVGFYNNGDRVEILEQKTVGAVTWGKTSKGWISLQYVVLDNASQGDTTTGNDTATDNDTTTDNNTSTDTTAVTGTVKVNDYLRVRSGAGTSFAQVGYLYNGNKVTITEQTVVGNTTWGKTDKGWVSMDYIVLDGQQNTDTDADVRTITASCLRIRKDASTDSTVVGYLYKGAKVTILETKTVNGAQWGRISNGWISMEYVQ